MSEFSHITASPLQWPTGWPRAKARKRAKFSTGGGAPGTYQPKRELSVSGGATRICDELRTLGVRDGFFIISSNLLLRNDGLPRSGQPEPKDPGVAVYWRLGRDKPQQVMAIDIYDRVADNLGAVAATLNALRAIERHGGSQAQERAFTGFAALPAPKTCWQILGLGAGASEEAIDATWRAKIRECRSRRPDGSDPLEADINAARDEALRQVRT